MPSLLIFFRLKSSRTICIRQIVQPVHPPAAEKAEIRGSLEPRSKGQAGQLNSTLDGSCKNVPLWISAGKQLLL